MARPRLDPADQVVQIALPRGVVERINRHVSGGQYQALSLFKEGKTSSRNRAIRQAERWRSCAASSLWGWWKRRSAPTHGIR